MRRAPALIIALLAFVPPVAGAAPKAAGDAPATGPMSACAECHAVGADTSRQSPNPQAPRFVDVAAMPSTTALSIKVFLRSSHRNMPNLMLDDDEASAIATYILGLRKK